jgi:tetratricopeptide (TPR) repeat protein
MNPADQDAARMSCPGAGILAAYLDGLLDGAERLRVEEHAADCGPCRGLLAAASRIGAALELGQGGACGSSSPRTARFRLTRRSAVAGLAAAAGIVLVAALPWKAIVGGRDSRQAQLADLVDAVGAHRLIEPRLTGGFLPGPLASVTRGPGDPLDVPAGVRAAAAELEQAAQEKPSPMARAYLATAEAMLGRGARAVALLEQAARDVPDSAEVWSDLAAARLAVAGTSGDRSAAEAALEAADRALTLSPSLAEALYNRALALEALGRMAEARRAWERCAATESDPGWSKDARRRAQALGDAMR